MGENATTEESSEGFHIKIIKTANLSREEIIALIIAIILIIIYAIITIYGRWKRRMNYPECSYRYSGWVSAISWVVVYGLSLFGYFYIFIRSKSQKRKNLESRVLGLYLTILFLMIIWDILYYYCRCPLASLGVSVIMIVISLYLFYETWIVSPLAAIFQIPILLRTFYMFYWDCHFAHCFHTRNNQ